MNKALKKWLFAATSLFVVGLIIFGGVLIMLKWDFTKLSTTKYRTVEHTITEAVENIVINTKTADVTFLPSNGEEIRVISYEQKKMPLSVTVTDGTLTIKVTDTRKWYDHIGFYFGTPSLTVYLPEGTYGALSVSVSTGCVTIPDGFRFESIDITGTTSDVECSAAVTGAVNVNTSTGDITLEGTSVGSLSLSVSTGKVCVKDVVCDGAASVKVSTGDSHLVNLTCKSFATDGNTGDVSLTGVLAEHLLSVKRSTGDVRLDECDAHEILIETDTGDVTGTLLSDKIFIPHSDTGKVSVPETATGGICKITTDTGDIRIEIAQS